MDPIECAEKAVQKLKEETAVPVKNFGLGDSEPSIFESKVGGTPYLPHNREVPCFEGKQMKLLAQINCKDLQDMPGYPHEGMLQFWLLPEPGFDHARVTYEPAIDPTVTETEVLSRIIPFVEGMTGTFPVVGSGYAMQFEDAAMQSISKYDCRFQALFCQYYSELADDWISLPEEGGEEVYDIYEWYADASAANGYGHKIGGYHTLAQLTDYVMYYPGYKERTGLCRWREYTEGIDVHSDDEEILLFQLEHDHGFGKDWFKGAKVIWGDCGTARFMISRRDFNARRFDRAYMIWECS